MPKALIAEAGSSCPFPGCGYQGPSPRSVSTHWAHKHEGPCPLTNTRKVCLSCGEMFWASLAMLRHRPVEYCSRECWSEATRVEVPEQSCDHCGEPFQPKDNHAADRRKYCSTDCAWSAQIGRYTSRQAVECEECDESFDEIPYRIERGRRYCSHACASRAKDEGRTSLQVRYRSGEKAKGWIQEVLRRDDYTCQSCGKRGHVHVHHRTPVSEILGEIVDGSYSEHPLFANVDNGVTLCPPCHDEEHRG